MIEETAKTRLIGAVRARIARAASEASLDDRESARNIVAEAQTFTSTDGTAIVTYTSGVSAILFQDANPHNRDWSPSGSKGSVELERRMRGGLWRWNGDTVKFYTNGHVADGQHRLAASALAGFTMISATAYGLDHDAISTVDNGLVRPAHSAAKLAGISDAKTKEAVLRGATGYIKKRGATHVELRSETEVANAIKSENAVLETAIEIGRTVGNNIVTPVLRQTTAAIVAYIHLQAGWREEVLTEKLALFQQGISKTGESDPFFTAADIISKSRMKIATKDRLSSQKEVGIVVYVMGQSAKGVSACRKQDILNSVKKGLPDPSYPLDGVAE